MTDFAVSRLFC